MGEAGRGREGGREIEGVCVSNCTCLLTYACLPPRMHFVRMRACPPLQGCRHKGGGVQRGPLRTAPPPALHPRTTLSSLRGGASASGSGRRARAHYPHPPARAHTHSSPRGRTGRTPRAPRLQLRGSGTRALTPRPMHARSRADPAGRPPSPRPPAARPGIVTTAPACLHPSPRVDPSAGTPPG